MSRDIRHGGDWARLGRPGMKYFCVSNIFGFIIQLFSDHEGEDPGQRSDDGSRTESLRLAWDTLRSAPRGESPISSSETDRSLGGGETDDQTAKLLCSDQG